MGVRGEDEERKEKLRNEAGEFKMRNVEEKFSIGKREHVRISVQSSMHLVDASVQSSLSWYLSSASFENGT